MPVRRISTVDIREMLRHMRQGRSDRGVARALGIDRKTVGRYRVWAIEQGLLTGPLPTLEDLQRLLHETWPVARPPQNVSSIEPYREVVDKLRAAGVEVAAIHQRLQERGYSGSYSSVYRFISRQEPRTPVVTVRVETPAGEEGQVDFGHAGLMVDPETGELRKTWVFVMTLSFSRHQYVEFVFDQTVATWLLLHCHAFAFFGGVPQRVVIDNLKAGIARACWAEPEAQHAYRECAEHYGFLIAPCRPYTPQHKGKVEQGVHYVKRNFLGGREPTPLTQANRDVLRWVLTTAGQRDHGTTHERPLDRFQIERAALLPLPATPYDLATWKQVKLHRDCYVVFEQAYYSAPFRLVGELLWVRGGSQQVRIYTATYQLVATHDRAAQPGARHTNPDHLPTHKVPGLQLSRESCHQQASTIGPATLEVVERLLAHRPEDRLRTAGRLLRLGERFGPERLEAACARAVRFDDATYTTIKHILAEGLDRIDSPVPVPAPAALTFARPVQELVGHLAGGAEWN